MAVLSKVFAASCKGVTKTVVLSARLTFLLILVIKLAVSKLTPFNCKGVTYIDPLSATFTLLFNAAFTVVAVKLVIFDATSAFTTCLYGANIAEVSVDEIFAPTSVAKLLTVCAFA